MFKPNAPVEAQIFDLARGVREDFDARHQPGRRRAVRARPASARRPGVFEGHEVEDMIHLAYKGRRSWIRTRRCSPPLP